MSRISGSLTTALALAVLCVTVALIAACAPPGSTGGQGSTTVVIPTFSPPPFQAPPVHTTPGPLAGGTAIKPHLDGVPAFTTQDMADYAKGYLPGGSSGFTIARDEFLPSQDVGALLGVSTGQPDGILIGLLVAQGTFLLPGGVPDIVHTYPFAFEVFDAKTGNLLMQGGLTQPVPNQAPTATVTPTTQPTQPPNPPRLSVTPTQTTGFCLNGLWPNKLAVKNTGGGTLTWHISTSLPSGISAAPSSGSLGPGASQDVTFSGHGGPSFTITFSSNGGSQNVAITCN